MEKLSNADLKTIIAEQQEKHNKLTNLLERQLEAQNSQQQQHTEIIRLTRKLPETARHPPETARGEQPSTTKAVRREER